MAVRRRMLVVAALAASVALLAGCTPAPALPKPISEAEREFLEAAPTAVLADECSSAAGVLDVQSAGGRWTPVVAAGFDEDEVTRQFFACESKYTSDPAGPSPVDLLTDDERAWIWSYDQTRLVPCLQLLGYDLENRSGGYIKSNGPFWSPYSEMVPVPASAGEWARIDRACPPSPVGPAVRPEVPVG
ncbi:MAG: hypothetical protein JWR04_2780 [Rhodoglobus sp.]|nr:hypothetical protein [Rhodoglobus sp.]